MLQFYKKAIAVFLLVCLACCLLAYVCIDRTFLHLKLLPKSNSELPWVASAGADKDYGGATTIQLHDVDFSLDFEIHLKKGVSHPYAGAALAFGSDPATVKLIDLSPYQSLSFSAKCGPENVLSFLVYTVDEHVTKLSEDITYRSPMTFFSCSNEWRQVTIDLTRLETQTWWLSSFGLELSDQAYDLHRVSKISVGSSPQSPFDVDAKIQLEGLTLHGRDWRYLYLLGGVLVVFWGGYLFWLFRAHSEALVEVLKEKLQKDRPLIAYQQLSVEPKRDRDKSAILSYLATEYANPDLNLELVVSSLGVSRSKINDILREELGYTFSAYLNKLRLTEAARLLSTKDEANVAEIAYSVGYKNVSYFNKLFKEEYECTPKTFKNASLSQ